MTETNTNHDNDLIFIGSCFCSDCDNYDLVFEIEQCGYYVQCHDTLYSYDKDKHGRVLKKRYPIDFHMRNSHHEWPDSLN
jgi:hypothetical protein